MAPQDYIQARKDTTKEVVEIDGRPYWPFLAVDTASLDSVKEVAAKVLLGGSLNLDELEVSPVSGGNTNQLFRISGWKKVLPSDSVLVRIFGAEGIIDRDVENSTYAALWHKSLVPIYYGRFANGRIEEFLDGMRPLQDKELANPDISPKIAQHMAHLHASFEVPDELKAHHSEPRLWNELGEWMAQALAVKSYKVPTDSERAKELVDIQKIPGQIEWLKKEVVPSKTSTAFCHNDVLASNVMYSEERNEIQLIDFEYGGVNFAAFDIANHFNEFAGGTDNGVPNYDLFPTVDFQRQFIQHYLQALEEYQQKGSARNVSINELLEQVQAFVLVDHLYWGLWGLNQSATEGTEDFDYLLYGSHRINEYYRQKKILKKDS